MIGAAAAASAIQHQHQHQHQPHHRQPVAAGALPCSRSGGSANGESGSSSSSSSKGGNTDVHGGGQQLQAPQLFLPTPAALQLAAASSAGAEHGAAADAELEDLMRQLVPPSMPATKNAEAAPATSSRSAASEPTAGRSMPGCQHAPPRASSFGSSGSTPAVAATASLGSAGASCAVLGEELLGELLCPITQERYKTQ